MKYARLAASATMAQEHDAPPEHTGKTRHTVLRGLHQARLRLLKQHRIARTKLQETFEQYVLETKISQK